MEHLLSKSACDLSLCLAAWHAVPGAVAALASSRSTSLPHTKPVLICQVIQMVQVVFVVFTEKLDPSRAMSSELSGRSRVLATSWLSRGEGNMQFHMLAGHRPPTCRAGP